MKISPLTGTETLEQISLFVRSATTNERLPRFEKAKKNVEGIKGRSAVFISPFKTINGKLNDKERINLWSLRKMSHMPRTEIATTERVSTAKSLKFTSISGNISFSSTPARSTRPKAKLDI